MICDIINRDVETPTVSESGKFKRQKTLEVNTGIRVRGTVPFGIPPSVVYSATWEGAWVACTLPVLFGQSMSCVRVKSGQALRLMTPL